MRIPLFLALLCFAMINCIASDSDCEVIEHFTNVELIEGKLLIHRSNLIQINNREGEYFNPLYIHYNQKEHISTLKISLETTDGNTIRVIKKKEIEVESAIGNSSFYEDDLVKKVKPTHNVYPYRIRYSYTKTLTEFLSIARWQPYLRSYIPTNHSILTVTLPPDLPLNIHQQNTSYNTSLTDDGRIKYSWEARNIKKYEPEEFGPHFSEVVPYVHMVPETFKYGVEGSHQSWESFGNWIYRLNEGLSDLPIQEQQKVDRLVSAANSTIDTIRILYHNLQDRTRYINVAIDIGGLQTYPATYVCKNGYGDCKSLSNYLYAQLKYLGIKSYYTLVNAGNATAPIICDFPSNQFNHVMLCVPLDKDTLWLECTNKSNPFGYIGSFTQNRYGLLTDQQNSKLVKIPGMSVEQVTESRYITMNASAGSNAVAKVSMQLKGGGFELARYITNQVEERERDDYIRRYLKVPETEMLSWSLNNPHRDSSTMVLSSTFKARRYYSELGNLTLISPPAIKTPDLKEPEKREWPVNIQVPIRKVDSLKVSFHNSEQLESIPLDTLISSSVGHYARSIQREGNHLLMIRDFSLNPTVLPANEYSELYNFLNTVGKLDDEKILLKK